MFYPEYGMTPGGKMPAPYTKRRQLPGVFSVVTSLACWFLFFCWLLGVYVRGGGSQGSGLEM